MIKPAKTRPSAFYGPTVARRRIKLASLSWLLIAAILPLAILLAPLVLSTYHTQQAGVLLQRVLAWPEPRHADSLPVLRDHSAATEALAHLRAAIKWRPNNTLSYQRAALIYAANSEWNNAADMLDKALNLQPNDPLLAWNLALINERILDIAQHEPREKIVADLLSAPVEAPSIVADTIYCQPGQPASCYVAFERFAQPFAGDPSGEAVQLDSLFMYPPSAVKLERMIYATHPVLTFAMGLDPNMAGGKSDGASFEVWITAADGIRRRVFENQAPPASEAKGWVQGQVDLSPWIGQTVTLELRTTGGPAGNTIDDWYAWGDVSMTTPAAALINRYLVERRLRELWADANLSMEAFAGRADEQLRDGNPAAADAWYRRALLAGQPSHGLQFRAQTAAAAHSGALAVAAAYVVDAPAAGTRLTVGGPDLRWLSDTPATADIDGQRLGDLASPAPQIGSLWWDGAAIMLVRAETSSRYQLTVRVQHAAPAPIDLAIESNFRTVKRFSLGKGDWSWEDISADITLHRGVNVIGIHMLNDEQSSGVDRNAFVELLHIDRPAGGAD